MAKYAPKIEHKPKYTKEDIKQAKFNGVEYNTFLGRINRGWSVSQAINTPPAKKQRFTKEELAIMETNGIKKSAVYLRLERGYPREVAISYPPNKHWVGEEREAYRKSEQLKIKDRVYKKTENKPHLLTVPQSVEGRKWFEHLSENDIFPKRKVEC